MAILLQKGGKTNYYKTLTDTDKLVWDSIVMNKQYPNELRDRAANAMLDVYDDIPSSVYDIEDSNNINEINYLNSLVGKVSPTLTQENLRILMGSNSPKNLYDKIKLARDSGITQSDVDSITKYLPNVANTYNITSFKSVFKKQLGGVLYKVDK